MIPFLQLTPGEDAPAVHAAIDRVITRGWFVLGPELDAFEQEFAAATGAAHAVGVGNTGPITLGGKHDPNAGGPPLTITAEIVTLSNGRMQTFGPMGGGVWRDYGLSALLRVGGIDIAVISNNGQATDIAQLTSLGCDPTRKSTVAVKSNHHFRAAFEPLAREVITIDGGGLGSMILRTLPYKNTRRPIWPLDTIP